MQNKNYNKFTLLKNNSTNVLSFIRVSFETREFINGSKKNYFYIYYFPTGISFSVAKNKVLAKAELADMDIHQLYKLYNPVNLGVDFSDDEVPKSLRDALVNATNSDPLLNQYSPNMGLSRLLKAIAQMYSKILDFELKPDENILATVGATEALHVALLSYTSPGDEWIVIEPAYTKYVPMIKMAHGIPRFTSLKPRESNNVISGRDWVLDRKEIESLFTEKTKGIIINNPNNPIGKVYTLDELEFIADLAKKRNVLVISDEAHEWIIYEPYKHIRIASLPKMFERTITIGSASKSFSVTGWRIGWVYGPTELLNAMKLIHSNSVHSCPTPQQEAIAVTFEEEFKNFGKPDSYFIKNLKNITKKRDEIKNAFSAVGMLPSIPDAGNCMLVNWTTLEKDIDLRNVTGIDKGTKFNNWMIKNIGILGVPSLVFYNDEHKLLGEDYVRYCFHKKEDTIKEASKRLKKLIFHQNKLDNHVCDL